MLRDFVRGMVRCGGRVQSAEPLRISQAFAIAVCRIEEATRLGSVDPVRTLSNSASEGSRKATKSMLRQLDFNDVQVRVMQRILAGSSSGWPGMIRLFLSGEDLEPTQRSYLRRQIRQFMAEASTPAEG